MSAHGVCSVLAFPLAIVASSCESPRPVERDALTIRLQHADAHEVALCLNDLHEASLRGARNWPPSGGCQCPAPVNASIPWCAARDGRTLVVTRLDGSEDMERFHELVARFDVPIGHGS